MNRNAYNSKGIRIHDAEDNVVTVHLPDILCEIEGPTNYHWSIMFMEIFRYYGAEECVGNLENEAKNSPCGLFITWDRLNRLAQDAVQFEDLILIGCQNKNEIMRREKAVDQYENSDIYIEMFDCSYWEVFSKEHAFIDRLSKKFKDVELLSPDFNEEKGA